ncbi:hypothetical protein DPMN_050907 [Dreissena polymorpha]|uniref:Uncharacterized protein n=1 Tax=Dreissena polymorpha TaxID=45954 RepID=A0A9D4CIG3_DREPO|nr:hypothetical protein DPMN_050907 [Dreissena polymorpha]
MSGRSSQGSAARRSAFMAALEITGRRLHPRDGFPSTLSVLSIAVPGSLYRATLDVHGTTPRPPQAVPGPPRMSPTLVVSLSHCFVPLQTGPLAGSVQ